MEVEKVLIIGISGVTCGGKTTLATELKKLIPDSIVLNQDDYCLDLKDSRHIWCEELNHINFDVITGLDMDKMISDVKAVIGSRKLYQKDKHCSESESNGFTYTYVRTKLFSLLKEKNIHLIILDGFLLYAYKPLLSLIHLKYFFTLEKEECLRRRNMRTYNPPDVQGYFEQCVWPEYVKHFEEVKATITDVSYLDRSIKDVLETVLTDIYCYLK